MIKNEHKDVVSFPTLTIPLTYIGKGIHKKAKKKLKIDPNKLFSPAFIPYLTDKSSIQIYFGGAGSGKSVFLARRTIMDMLAGKRNFLVVRKVFGTLRDSFFTELEKAAADLGVTKYFKFKVAPMEIHCKTTGRKAIFRGLDKAEKIKSITVKRGILTDIIIEEGTELTEPDFDLLDTRLRGKCDVAKRITILFNPIHKGHWLYTRYFAGNYPDEAKLVTYDIAFSYTDLSEGVPKRVDGVRRVLIHKTNHWDNKFLAPEDRVRYESWKKTNPHMYNVYALGNWGVLGDIIFPDFEKRDLSGVAKHFDELYDGLDFGWNPDPFAYVVCGMRGDYVYVFLEEEGRRTTTEQIATQIKPHCGYRDVYCDTNEPRTMVELNDRFGINTHPVTKWSGNNETAIAWFHKRKIIVDYRCKTLISQLEEYSYQKDKNGHTISKPCEGRGKNGHHDLISAMFYAFNYQIAGSRVTKIT
jgi:phage terminase large subunit